MSLVRKQNEDDDDSAAKKSLIELKPNMVTQSRFKKPMKILDEESFIKKLENIIEKSFFPDLERLKVQKMYYEAMRNNDFDALRELYSKYSNLLTPSTRKDSKATPAQTPLFVPSTNRRHSADSSDLPYANEELHSISFKSGKHRMQNEEKNVEPKCESLDEFLAKNTSEDNVSFEMLIGDAEKKQKARMHQSWLHEKEKLHELRSSEAMLMIDNGPKTNDDITKSLDTWKYTSKNTLMYVPDGAALTLEEEIARTKKVRKINHENTRLSARDLYELNRIKTGPPESSTSATSSASIKDNQSNSAVAHLIGLGGASATGKVGIDGKEDAKDTPKIRGYSLVDMSPAPTPGKLAGDESPMMFWGEIDSTPFRLDGSETPYMTPRLSGVPEFKMPSIPEREKIALGLDEKAGEERRKKKEEAIKQFQRCLASPTRSAIGLSSPSSSTSFSERVNSMSPAARLLLSSKLKTNSPSPYTGKAQKSAIDSPRFGTGFSSPLVKHTSSSSTSSSSSSSSTSIDNLRTNLKRPSDSSTSSLTDNLLKLPKNG